MKKKLAKYSALTLLVLFIALANINGQTPTPTPTGIIPRILLPSLEIIQTKPVVLMENQPMRVYFKFSNDDVVKKIRNGFIRGEFKNGSFRVQATDVKIRNLQPGQSFADVLTLRS